MEPTLAGNLFTTPAAAPIAAATPTSSNSGFGQVLVEVIETERSYLSGLDALLSSYRPALQPLAPTVLTPLFKSIEGIHHASEELLGRVDAILEGYLLQRARMTMSVSAGRRPHSLRPSCPVG